MTRKATTKGPVVFAEWVIGGPIIPIRAKKAKAKKKGPTEVITVKVTADDDNDTDTLHVTYPRSRRIAPEADGGEAKKVHFDKGLSKSALKNGKTQATSKGSDTDSTAVASSDTSGDETTDASSDDESSKASKDSCNCCRCIKRHRKHTKCTKEAESSADEAAESKCTKCGNKAKAEEDDKTKKKTDTENKKDKDKDKDDKNDKTNDKSKNKNKDKDKATEDKGAEDKAEEKSDTEAAKDKDKKNEKGKEKETKNADTSEAKSSKSKDKEPEKLPLHAPGKAPNLIAPIRAQVVQTEAVIEDSQDPRPNAFYDAAHNIMRVYYGPVYGNHDNRSLYPRHDATGLPLHLGMPYPPHHPYFYGFKDGPPAPSPMTGYPLPPHLAHADTGSHRGAFSKPPSVHDDIAGRNNVVPVPTTTPPKTNPYYNNSKPRTKSVFAGSSSRHGSPSHGPPKQPSPVPAPPSEPAAPGWGDNNTTAAAADNGFQVSAGANDGGWSQDANTAPVGWTDTPAQPSNTQADNAGGSWGNQQEDNVGMPGGWQDTTMAASTGGKVDNVW